MKSLFHWFLSFEVVEGLRGFKYPRGDRRFEDDRDAGGGMWARDIEVVLGAFWVMDLLDDEGN